MLRPRRLVWRVRRRAVVRAGTAPNVLQSATDAMNTDASEKQILACLLHDLGGRR